MHVWQRYSLADLESGNPKTVKRIRRDNAARVAFVGFQEAGQRAAMAMRRFVRALEVANERAS